MKKILSTLLIFNLFFLNLSFANDEYHKVDFNLNKNKIQSSHTENSYLNVFDTLEDASQFLNNQMLKREKNVKIGINEEYYKGMYNDLFDLVFENNSKSSSEGDYLFWHLNSHKASVTTNPGYVEFNINLKYLSTYEEELLVDKKVKEVLDKLNVYDANDYEKVKAVHDYIVKNIEYDHSLKNYTAYNAIIEENVVCQGFASLTYKMLKELGVEVRIVSGRSNNQDHGWNIVKLNDKWYNIDNTWDEGETNRGKISYKYFLKSPTEFDKNHKRDERFNTYEFNKKYPMAKTSFNINNTTENTENTSIPSNNNQPTISTPMYGVTDISNHWAKNDIIEFLTRGYINGYPNKTFKPNGIVTRAEFIKIANIIFDIDENNPEVKSNNLNINYLDVPKNSWFYKDIMNALKYGYVEGDGNLFNPNEKVNREEIAKMIVLITKTEDKKLNKIYNFNDWTEISKENKTFVEGALENGFLGGYTDNTIKPKRYVTRAEVVSILNRIK